ncbi:hypothetical protein PIB30_016523 [Stylosanthes scabra]|uniref:Uncharacterized protein n=1 Tax=Stylosanthes scabra TaxID=79078 RepID=A0ABU6Q7E3_9FABA|nr:hypothetical protein [Stylosanthes scabra]
MSGSKSTARLGFAERMKRPYWSELKKGSVYAAIEIRRSVGGGDVYEHFVVVRVDTVPFWGILFVLRVGRGENCRWGVWVRVMGGGLRKVERKRRGMEAIFDKGV